MKTAFVLRGSQCFGDQLMISWTPKQIKEKLGYDELTVSTWKRNKCIWDNNPYIDEFIIFDKLKDKNLEETLDEWRNSYDKFFDFRYSVELKYLRNTTDNELTLEQRRKTVNNENYYEHALKDYDLIGQKGEIYYSDAELKIIEQLQKTKQKKRICWQLEGTGRNKILIFLPAYINETIKKYPDIEHWIVGERHSNIGGLNENKIVDMRGKWKPRDTIINAKTFDLIVGPESFMTHVAGALDIPHICFFSHSAPKNLTKHFKNSYNIVPQCHCSPCYLILKDFRQALNLNERKKAREQEEQCLIRDKNDLFRGVGFRCCIQIDHQKVLKTISEIIEA